MRGTFVIRGGELVPKYLASPIIARGPRGALACPAIISDTMDALKGMHDGRMYDSKSALRRSYREHGVVELGSDAPRAAPSAPEPDIPDATIGKALAKVKAGYKPRLSGEAKRDADGSLNVLPD